MTYATAIPIMGISGSAPSAPVIRAPHRSPGSDSTIHLTCEVCRIGKAALKLLSYVIALGYPESV